MRLFNPFPLPIMFLSMLCFQLEHSYGSSKLPLPLLCKYHCHRQYINGSYLSSLRSLLSSLSFYATGNIKFYGLSPTLSISSNASSKIQISGHNMISIPIHTIHIIFLCRGDVNTKMCAMCVGNATQSLVEKCSREQTAVIWYDECMLRYSNESIFYTEAVRPIFHLYNTQNITEQDRFNRLVNSTLTELASQASNVPAGFKKFGVKEVKFSDFQNLYNLVQCTPDLSSTNCNSCLLAAIKRLSICCSGKQGARALFPSCNVGYELYLLYNESMAATPTPLPHHH